MADNSSSDRSQPWAATDGHTFISKNRIENEVNAIKHGLFPFLKRGARQRARAALAACEQALRDDPTNAHASCQQGDLLRELTRYDEALAAYERALQLDPRSADAWVGKAAALERLGRPVEAQAAYQQAREIGAERLDQERRAK